LSEVKKELIPTEALNLLSKSMEYLNSIIDVQITNEEEFSNAGPFVGELKKHKKKLDDTKLGITKDWRTKTGTVNARFKAVVTSLDNGINKISRSLSDFQIKLENQKRIAQQKLDADAAEKRRLADEKAQNAIKKAEEFEAQGKTLQAEKATIDAEKFQEQADTTVAQAVFVPKPAGTSFSSKWEARVTNIEDCILGLLEAPDTKHLVTIDIKKIEALQKASKGMRRFEGIVFTERKTIINR